MNNIELELTKTVFDGEIIPDKLVRLEASTSIIQKELDNIALSIYSIGTELLYIKENVLEHGQYIKWVENILGMNRKVAHEYVKIAQHFTEDDVKMLGNNVKKQILYKLTFFEKEELNKEYEVIKMDKDGNIEHTGEYKKLQDMSNRQLEAIRKLKSENEKLREENKKVVKENKELKGEKSKRGEDEFADKLEDFLEEYNLTVFERKYRVLGYEIDMYLPEINVAVEYDENAHKYYPYPAHEGRQKEIEEELGCEFVRVADFANMDKRIAKAMKQILILHPELLK